MKKIIIILAIILLLIVTLSLYFGKYEIILGILIALGPLWNIGLLIGLGIFLYNIGKNSGNRKARKELKKEIEKLYLENPYIYFRDIPNKYGIGVALILFNYKIDKADVLAGVLDLCAKGYIKLKQVGKNYEIYDTQKDRSHLLKNELYLLNWVLNKSTRKFKIKEWFNLAKEDIISLGLAIQSDKREYKPLFAFDKKFAKNLLFVSLGISFLIVMLLDVYFKINNGFLINIFTSIFFAGPLWLLLFFVLLFIALIYEGKIITYNNIKNNKLELTDLGKNEYHELYALCKFLNDFGRFSEKHIEEIIIWEQYLSYALLFRIGKNMLKTGYEKLLINDCFIIDDIDKIKIL